MHSGISILGLIFIIGGVLALSYTVTENNSYLFGAVTQEEVSKPYEQYGWPIIIAGVVIMALGMAVPSTKVTETYVDEHVRGHPGKKVKRTIVREEEI